jgi:predicted nucleic acid-binding protein
VTACVLDTDVVIGALDRADAHHEDAVRLVRELARDGTPLMLSVINYAEALVRPAESERALRAAVSAIDAMGVALISPTPPVAREAARLRHANISLADGFALATARAHGAWLATFDRRVRRSLGDAGIELPPRLR